MRVALIQLNATADKDSNLAKAQEAILRAVKGKAKFILLPEVFNWRGDARKQREFNAAENIPGPTTRALMALAKEHGVFILAGSVLEKVKQSNKAYNTSVLIDGLGRIIAKYRKIHLFDARLGDKIVCEADCFMPGRKKTVARVNDFNIGMSICYDLRFADLYKTLVLNGANVLVVPSCFTKITGQAHWESLLRARAIENLSYVLAPNLVGADARGMVAYGNSMVVSPWGEIIARASGDKEEIVFADIDVQEVQKARARLPGLIRL